MAKAANYNKQHTLQKYDKLHLASTLLARRIVTQTRFSVFFENTQGITAVYDMLQYPALYVPSPHKAWAKTP